MSDRHCRLKLEKRGRTYYAHVVWAARKKGLGIKRLAAKMNVQFARLSYCINGEFKFRQYEREIAARILGYPESWLFTEPEPPASGTRSTGEACEGP
jgi:hypothetical protein